MAKQIDNVTTTASELTQDQINAAAQLEGVLAAQTSANNQLANAGVTGFKWDTGATKTAITSATTPTKTPVVTDSASAPKGSGNGSSPNGAPKATDHGKVVSTHTDENGNVWVIHEDGFPEIIIKSTTPYKSTVNQNAYALLEQTFADYGLSELTDAIKGYMDKGLGAEQAALELRKNPVYLQRFKGNELRKSAGLNVLSEGEYLALENSYNDTLHAYGVGGYFGTDRKAAQAKMADIIGSDISATEFKDRIDTVVTRVENSDKNIKDTLVNFYGITDTDLIHYFLNPKEGLPKLQEKVTSAEIGSEFMKQNLTTGVDAATALAKLGVDKQAAAKGASTIAGFLPEANKLSNIYQEEGINYNQNMAEQEVFNQLSSAERKRKLLANKEVASFSGQSGTTKGSFSTSYLNRTSSAGLI